ncbi:MAG: vanadium-dependent haloperoxidase [Blastocatellia bacterium]
MRTNTSWKRLVIVVTLGAALSGVPAYPAISGANAADPLTRPEWSGGAPVTARELTANPREVSGRSLKTELSAQANDAITEWNRQAVTLTVLPASALTPVQQTRVMAIVQVAVHDAVNGITNEYATYLSPGPPPEDASPVAASIAAAHHALRSLFDGQSALLDPLYVASLASHGLCDDDPGIEYGRSAAAAILALRANDHSDEAQYAYTAPGAGTPGVWVPLTSAPALLPGWGNVTPWVLRSGWQFRPDAPPALDSEQYARDYNEIKKIGVLNGSERTEEQTQIAFFWRASPTAIWNNVLSQVVATRNLDLSATARLFALFYLAAADASVACWEAKYYYNFWRPQPAIRSGNFDGNDLTAGDGTWAPLIATPTHPEYPSAHTTNSGAMAAILGLVFEDDPGVSIVVTISGITRQWDRFSQGVEEVIDARIYSGFHFRTADEVGARLGRQVARFVWTHSLRLCAKGGFRCA